MSIRKELEIKINPAELAEIFQGFSLYETKEFFEELAQINRGDVSSFYRSVFCDLSLVGQNYIIQLIEGYGFNNPLPQQAEHE